MGELDKKKTQAGCRKPAADPRGQRTQRRACTAKQDGRCHFGTYF